MLFGKGDASFPSSFLQVRITMTQQATNIHSDKILILDFGAQYTQLIARRIREIGVYCEIWAWDHDPAEIAAFGAKGIILSGGPESTTQPGCPAAPAQVFEGIDDPAWNGAAAEFPLMQESERYESMRKITHPGERIV